MFDNGALSVWVRLYIYAIHGYFTEIMFTAGWEFVVNMNPKFPGVTSVWSLFIYGVSNLVIERMYISLKDDVSIPVRLVLYTLWVYIWEFTTGLVLRQFDACPWDYTPFEWDFFGLVTLEYAPAWLIGVFLSEQVLIKQTLRLCFSDGQAMSQEMNNGEVKSKLL